MTLNAIRLKKPGGFDSLWLDTLTDPGAPGPGQIRVSLAASSLNYHDYAVVMGMIPSADGRIPMSDGAGTVEAVGEGVTQFKAGDPVVSTFFTDWNDGHHPPPPSLRCPATGSTAMHAKRS